MIVTLILIDLSNRTFLRDVASDTGLGNKLVQKKMKLSTHIEQCQKLPSLLSIR